MKKLLTGLFMLVSTAAHGQQSLNAYVTGLSAATTPLTGTELLYAIQGGVSKRVTTSNIATYAFSSASTLNLNAGSVDAVAGPVANGLTVTQQGTGSCSGQCYFNFINVTSDNVTGTAGQIITPLQISNSFGGTALVGNRVGLTINSNLTAKSGNTGGTQSYAGFAVQMNAQVNDGGTGTGVSTSSGGAQGGNLIGHLSTGATNFYGVNAAEFDVEVDTGASVFQKHGIIIALLGGDTVHGTTVDAAIHLTNQSGTAGWTNGLLFGSVDTGGTWPFISTATVITCVNCGTVANFIDMSAANITGSLLKGPNGVNISGANGNITTAGSITSTAGGLTAFGVISTGNSAGLMTINRTGGTAGKAPVVWQSAATETWELGPDSPGNNTNDFYIFNITNGFQLKILTTQTWQITGGMTLGGSGVTDEGAGTLNISGAYYSGGTVGVTCNAQPTAAWTSKNGIVTHC